jgi:hypothetical protein
MDVYLSWAKDFVSWLWTKGWRGKLAAVVGTIVLLAVSGIWGIPKLLPPAQGTVVPTSPIKGAVNSYSPDGWPIINNTTVHLSGVSLIAASKHDRFAAWVTANGGNLECDSSDHGLTYRCLTPGIDVTKGIPLDGPLPQIKGAVSSYSPDGWPIIDNTTVRLSGVRLIVASKHDRFAGWITSHGGYLECDSSNGGNTYRCLTAQRLDVAQTVLLNGAAQATCDADPLYRAAEDTGKRIAGGRSTTSALSCR